MGSFIARLASRGGRFLPIFHSGRGGAGNDDPDRDMAAELMLPQPQNIRPPEGLEVGPHITRDWPLMAFNF